MIKSGYALVTMVSSLRTLANTDVKDYVCINADYTT